MNPSRRLFGQSLMILAVLSVLGCGTSRVDLKLHGVVPLNPNDQNESTSVRVCFYPLRSDKKFQSATVDALWTADKQTLGEDLVADPTTTIVHPGNVNDPAVVFDLTVPASTQFLGILAQYPKADAEDHRMLIVPFSEVEHHVINFTGFSVMLAPTAKAKGESTSDGLTK